MRKRVLIAMATLAMAASLAACGSKGDAAKGSTKAGSEAAETKASEGTAASSEKAEEKADGKIVVETGAYPEGNNKMETGDKPGKPDRDLGTGSQRKCVGQHCEGTGIFSGSRPHRK